MAVGRPGCPKAQTTLRKRSQQGGVNGALSKYLIRTMDYFMTQKTIAAHPPRLEVVPQVAVDPQLVTMLTERLCGWYVRRDGKFYDVDRPGVPLSQTDVQRIALSRLSTDFPDAPLTADVLKRVFHRAITEVHNIAGQSISVWCGSVRCKPGSPGRLLRQNGSVAINSWQQPDYRLVQGATVALDPVDDFLRFFFVRDAEKEMFLNWLAWCLQNEADKPAVVSRSWWKFDGGVISG